jgi:putative transposase
MTTGRCSAPSPKHSPDRTVTDGSSPLTHCFAGTVAASPNIGHNQPRNQGELTGLGQDVGAATVWRILKNHGIDPAPQRSTVTWTQFLRSQTAVACDFATVDTAQLRRYYLLFFIDVTNREVFFAGITTNPTGPWTTQAGRNLFVQHPNRFADARALVRDRGSQFTAAFDEIFRTEGIKTLKTPVRTPVANTFAERWIGTLRRELLDRTIIWNQQLEQLVTDYIDHYKAHHLPTPR